MVGLALSTGATILGADSSAEAARDQAKLILDTAGLKGGLIAQVGCGDGQMTAALPGVVSLGALGGALATEASIAFDGESR